MFQGAAVAVERRRGEAVLLAKGWGWWFRTKTKDRVAGEEECIGGEFDQI